MKTFLDLGYDTIAYDQRNSGENMAAYNTIGVLEAKDASAVIDHIKEKYPDGKVILWGESMGALTSVIAAGENESNIDYLILESPASNGLTMIVDQMRDIAKDQGIPLYFLVRMGDWYSKLKLGYNFTDMDGTTYMKNITKPTLITNSKADTLTPPYMAEDLYAAKTDEKKELVSVEGYKHGSFAYEDREGYKK